MKSLLELMQVIRKHPAPAAFTAAVGLGGLGLGLYGLRNHNLKINENGIDATKTYDKSIRTKDIISREGSVIASIEEGKSKSSQIKTSNIDACKDVTLDLKKSDENNSAFKP